MNAIASFRLCKLSNNELIQKIDDETDDIFKNQEVPTRHIPARPDADYDLLIGELILRFGEILNTGKSLPSSSEMGKCRFCGGDQCDSDSHK